MPLPQARSPTISDFTRRKSRRRASLTPGELTHCRWSEMHSARGSARSRACIRLDSVDSARILDCNRDSARSSRPGAQLDHSNAKSNVHRYTRARKMYDADQRSASYEYIGAYNGIWLALFPLLCHVIVIISGIDKNQRVELSGIF